MKQTMTILKIFGAGFVTVIAAAAVAAVDDGAPAQAESSFDAAFRNPPPGYGEVPFWWWSGERLDKNRLLWQIEELHRAGISGVQVNYSHLSVEGWKTAPNDPKIFSDEWWDCFSFAAVECAKRDMGIGLSGYTLDWPGRDNLYRTLGICAPDTCGKVLVMEDGRVVPKVKPDSLDPLNPEPAKRLIERFLNPFLERVPKEAHKALNYFFQDELKLLADLRVWSDDFADEFRKRKGYDVVPKLPGLFGDIGPETDQVRLDFNDVQVALTEERFFKPIYDWHASRGMIYGCDPGSRGKNPMEFGDYMRCVRWYTAPGFDTPGGGPDPVKCKVGSSIAHLNRRPRVWLEGYHSLGWQASTETIFAATARNYVYGANLLNLHGLYYTTFGGWWEWAPPCYHFRQPYWTLLPKTLRYFERLSWALTRGVHVCDVAILMPQEEMVLDRAAGAKANALAHALVGKLAVHGTQDCDFLDSEHLAAATVERDGRGVALVVAGERYRVVIVPRMRRLRTASAAKLAAFEQAGGRVIRANRADDVKLPLFAEPDVAGNPGLKVNHRRTATEDIYYLVDWDGRTDVRFRDGGELAIYDLWTGERTDRPVPGQPVLAVVRRGTMPAVLKGIAEKRTVVAALPDEWEVEFKPTMDNRWGDFRLPAAPEMLGPEVREMTWVGQNEKTMLGYGPQFVQNDKDAYSFSWRYGPWGRPAYQNHHHGLNKRIGDTFLVLGPYSQGWDALYDVNPKKAGGCSPRNVFTSFVFAPCDLTAEVTVETEAVHETANPRKRWPAPVAVATKVGGRDVRPGERIALKRGYTPVEAVFAGFGRAAFVLRRTDVIAKESTMPLSMRWYQDPSVLRYDPFGGKVTRGTFTAAVPPGAYDAEVDVNGEVLGKEIKDGVLTLEIAFAPGLVGGSAFNGPVKLKMRPAKMKLGDWAKVEGLRCYSGAVVYRTAFDVPATDRKGSRQLLDLGCVGCAASVAVNGRPAHAVMCPPWEVDVTDDLRRGENAVEVTVYNTLNNHYQTIPTRYKVPTVKAPSGLIGPVRLLSRDVAHLSP